MSLRKLLAVLVCLFTSPTWAVKTSHWVHTTEADFGQGTFKNVVATNLGDLKLSREVKTLLAEDARVSAVFALAQASDGTIYAGTGPQGILLSIKDDKVTTAAELGAHINIFSLLIDSKGRLLIGTGGEKGEIYRIDKPGQKPKSIFSADGVQYIWAMTQTSDGLLYAATGPNGQLFQINPDSTNKVILDSDENNLLCLLSDGKDFLYVGTDPNGLVCRVNRNTGELFVVYDAPESEISALARDDRGNLYAATAESSEQQAGESDNAAADQVGRPESESHGSPIPSQPPASPKPPDAPNPSPGEPLPIPKNKKSDEPKSMMILAAPDDPPDAPDPEPASQPAMPGPNKAAPAGAAAEAAAPSNGNAIYKIDPDGFVTEVFRQPVSVFAMIEHEGTLLVATGNVGAVYQVNPAQEETLIVAKVDPKDVLCLLPAKDGRVLMGLANEGGVVAMTSGYAIDGTFTSPVLDATQISRFGKVHLNGTLPASTSLKFSTRSGNVEEASAPGWSPWSDDTSAEEFLQVSSTPARFLQYRLSFTSDAGKATPIVEDIDIAYQVPNLPPEIKSIKIDQPVADENTVPDGKVTISWEASDPNEDDLLYSIYFRRGSHSPWILLKDKLKDPTYDWETRSVGDGRYEIKVEASDAAANPPGQGKTATRVSDPIIVDNTPPIIGDIKAELSGGDATISLNVADRTTTVARLEYSVDSSQDWQSVLPLDNIADSPQEAYKFIVSDLPAGAHQITLRATDAKGNRSFESVNVTAEKKTK
ncbi:MAG TPA: hypothetical protein VKK61_04030 [Tepidisphaeraceae bacterium]|nr:hypothetical protein [Tepidisphaeraceae bacterium]